MEQLYGGEAGTITEQARRATIAFRAMQPSLSAFARAITGRRSVRVEIATGKPRTDGDRILYRPPLALGAGYRHERTACDVRDPETLLQQCLACRVEEEVYSMIFHEISHIAFGTFEKISESQRKKVLNQALASVNSKYAERVRENMFNAPDDFKESYLGMAKLASPFLPTIVNVLEDVRVDSRMFDARRGVKPMYDAIAIRTFRYGTQQSDGTILSWREADLNAQVMVGLICVACHYPFEGWFHEDVEVALKDSALTELASQARKSNSVGEVYTLSFKVLQRLRELGFCKSDSDPEDENEDGQPDPSDLDNSNHDDNDSAADSKPDPKDQESEVDNESDDQDSDSAGDPPDDSGTDASSGEDDTESQEDSQTGSDDDEMLPDAGSDENNLQQDQDDSDGSDEGEPENERGYGKESSPRDDTDNSDAGDREGCDREDQTQGEIADSEQSSSEPTSGQREEPRDSDSDGSGEALDDTTQSSNSSGNDPQDSNDTESSDSDESASNDGTEGQSESGGSSDGSGESSKASDNRQEGVPEVAEDQGDKSSRDDGLGEVDAQEVLEDLIDTGEDMGQGGAKGSRPNMGTADEIEGTVRTFGAHADIHDFDQPEWTEEQNEIDIAIDLAVIQGLYFETPSAHIGVVNVYKNMDTTTPGWRSAKVAQSANQRRHGKSSDIKIPESILGPATLVTRRTFDDNKRAKVDRNRKSGRIKGAALGKRAPFDDPRMFGKRTIPSKKSYSVVIGIDVSGSTFGENLKLAKRAAMAQAELCHRTGVDFAVYCHSSGGSRGRGFTSLDIYECKSFSDPWDDKHKASLSNIQACSGNLDGHSIEFYRKAAERTDATDKIVLYYSDGKMPAENHDEELVILQREIKYCRSRGIELMGVGIRTDSPSKHGLDTVQINSDEDLIKVVQHLGKRLLAADRK